MVYLLHIWCHSLLVSIKLRSVGDADCQPGRGSWHLGWCDFLHDRVCRGLPRLCEAIWSATSPQTCYQQGHWHWGTRLSAGWSLGYRKWYHLIQRECWSAWYYEGEMILYSRGAKHMARVLETAHQGSSPNLWMILKSVNIVGKLKKII